MTTPTITEMKLYDQLMQVRLCSDALKDISENIPQDDKYASVLKIVTDRLEQELNSLKILSLTTVREFEDIISKV